MEGGCGREVEGGKRREVGRWEGEEGKGGREEGGRWEVGKWEAKKAMTTKPPWRYLNWLRNWPLRGVT